MDTETLDLWRYLASVRRRGKKRELPSALPKPQHAVRT
jgi:hypothetical protein